MLGKYNSLYCIGDYLRLNPELFPTTSLDEEEKLEDFRRVVGEIEECGGGLVIDIVISHCSSLNPIFSADADAAYTLENTPHLSAAYVLDEAMQEFSAEIAGKQTRENYPAGNRVENTRDVDCVMSEVRERIKNLKLYEFFQINTEELLKEFILAENTETQVLDLHLDFVKEKGLKSFIKKFGIMNEGESRFGVKVNSSLLWGVCRALGMNQSIILREVPKEISSINALLYSRYTRHLQTIVKNIESEITYQKIELRVFEITTDKPLLKPYFTSLPGGQSALLNGFIINNKDVSRDISSRWEYLKRNVICWRDCVKLNYGSTSASCPVLWGTIERYVKSMSLTFKGFRLDNCHGTPLHVTKYFISKAREANPDLLVIAEFFSNSPSLDNKYVSAIGINYLIRESLVHKSVSSLASLVSAQNSSSPSSSSSYSYSYSSYSSQGISRKIPVLLYDFTHDNPTITQCRTTEDAISNAGIVAMFRGPVASTRGYDEVIPVQLSVVEEKREYLDYEEAQEIPQHFVMGATEDRVRVAVEYGGTARFVSIKGDWDGWRLPLELQSRGGKFVAFVNFPASQRGMEYGFKFFIDGTTWLCDSSQRNYRTWDGFYNNLVRVEENLEIFDGETGDIREVRKYINQLRRILDGEGYDGMRCEVDSEDVLVVRRENYKNFHSYVVVVHSVLQGDRKKTCNCSVVVTGYIEKVELFARIQVNGAYCEDHDRITGIPVKVTISSSLGEFGEIKKEGVNDKLVMNKLPPGSLIFLKTRPLAENLISEYNNKMTIFDRFSDCKYLVDGMSLQDVYTIIWGNTQQETRDFGRGLYKFSGFQDLRYNGIAGIIYALQQENLETIEKSIDESHPIFKNLFEGNWFLDYQVQRLQSLESKVFYFFVHDTLHLIKQMSRQVLPRIAVRFFIMVFRLIKNYTTDVLLRDVILPQEFLFSAVQYIVEIRKNGLGSGGVGVDFEFFCSLKLLITCKMHQEARDIILRLASTVKNGLVTGTIKHNYVNSVYFLYLMQEYLVGVPSDYAIFTETVNIQDASPKKLSEICHILFNSLGNSILDLESGLILLPPYQTWMSSKARSGCPIEILCLFYSSLSFFSSLPDFPQTINLSSSELSLTTWKSLINSSFESLYWIPPSLNSKYFLPKLCNTVGIYKDTVGSSVETEEYQCRPNVFLAMATAPDLFSEGDIEKCLGTCKKLLVDDVNLRTRTLRSGDSEYARELQFDGGEVMWVTAWYYVAALRLGKETKENAWDFVEKARGVLESAGNGEGSDRSGIAYASLATLISFIS